MSKAGHHGDVVYKFEDNGFDSTPTDTTFKAFGSSATVDTWEGSHEAVRVFNAERQAAEIVEQVFDGAWSVSGDLSEPPWWFQAVWGSPVSTETATTGLYDHDYDLDSGGDPETLRLYMPTDGFSGYEVLSGCAVATLTLDQSVPGSPEFSLAGAYAREPFNQSSPTISIPTLSKSTFNNRKASVSVNSNTVGRAQNATATLDTGTELVGEIGSGQAVDFTPKTFAPDLSFEKILFETETVDVLQRFRDATATGASLAWDNGQTSTDQYVVSVDFLLSFPSQWSETGRNDPEADLTQELQEMAEDANATITVDVATPPT